MWSDFKKVTTQGMHNNSASYAAGHWQISFNIKMLVGVSGVRCNVRPWLTYNIRVLFYIKDFFYNVSVCFLCFYSRVTDNRKTHDSGVQIVERGGSGERVKLYTGSGRVGGGGEKRFPPFPPLNSPLFFSSWIFLPRSTIRTPETGYQKSPWRVAWPRLKLETAQITTGIATWFLNFSKGSVWLSLVNGVITALWQNGSQQT